MIEKRVIFFLYFLFIAFVSVAQNEDKFKVTSRLTTTDGRVDVATVTIRENNRVSEVVDLPRSGRFDYEFDFKNEYVLTFECDGFYQKIVEVSTMVPDDILEENSKFPVFDFVVNLYHQVDGVDEGFSSQSVARIYYDEDLDNFDAISYYSDKDIEKIIAEAEVQESNTNDEAEEIRRIDDRELAQMERDYDSAISDGDASYQRQDYDEALLKYEEALNIFPNRSYASDRIAEIKDLMALMQLTALQVENDYQSAISDGDTNFDNELYKEASDAYLLALSYKENDAYATERFAESNRMLELQQVNGRYNELIAQADEEFSNERYNEARPLYEQAIDVKPDDSQYARDQIEAIDQELARQEQLELEEQQYNELIAKGDEAIKNEEYQDAILLFDEALVIREEDNYALDQKAFAEEHLLQQQNDALYADLIEEADEQFDDNLLNEASEIYNQALEIKPEEEYPKSKLSEIQRLLEEQSIQQQYDDIIALADHSFQIQKYDQAINSYEEALSVKPDEIYPSDQISKIEEELARLQELAEALEAEYQSAISTGRDYMSEEAFSEARELFLEAKDLKPEETLPDELIAEADSLEQALAEALAREEALRLEREENYQAAIAEADQLLADEELESAKENYENALSFKPEEEYPQEQIAFIDAELNRIAEQESAYNNLINEADDLVDSEEYSEAINTYNEALELKPEEEYPKEQISQLEERLAELAAEQELEENYQASIDLADSYFDEESYDSAKNEYQNALEIKPEESYPAEKIIEINDILAEIQRLQNEQERLQQEYDNLITNADQSFEDRQWQKSRIAYTQALELKPEESYPQQQLDEIDRLEIQEVVEMYEQFISLGDDQYDQTAYVEAIESYQQALEWKDGDEYAQSQIDQINDLIAQLEAEEKAQMELDEEYQSLIASADNQFNDGLYDEAKSAYLEALVLKPEEQYPTERITEIERIIQQLAEQAETDVQYNQILANANNLYDDENFEDALSLYQEAHELKPEELFPSQRIEEIQNLVQQLEDMARLAAEEEARKLQMEQERQAQYDEAVADGDKELQINNFENAQSFYTQALSIFPNEQYPQNKLDEIDRLMEERRLEELARQEQAYQDSLLAEQQRNYNEKLEDAKGFIDAEQFVMALTAYQEAISIMPSKESELSGVINQLENKIQELEALETNYNKAIADADRYFEERVWDDARNNYRKALALKRDEAYPQSQLVLIEQRIQEEIEAEQAMVRMNEEYQRVIYDADLSFERDNYYNAKELYETAHNLKPNEEYPIQQIAELDTILAEIQAQQQELEDEYNQFIAKADQYFNDEDYSPAREEYMNALELKPGEQYPQSQILELDSLLRNSRSSRSSFISYLDDSDEHNESNSTNEYDKLIRLADSNYTNEGYKIAQFYYYQALNVAPEESYPQQRIQQIAEIINTRMNQEDLIEYDKAIEQADLEFDSSNYPVARFYYNKALEFKSWEQYPKDQLEEIRKISNTLLSQVEEEKYKELIAIADEAFYSDDYSVARSYYNKALEIRREEQYPIIKLHDIEVAIAKNDEELLSIEFYDLVAKADNAFEVKEYAVARTYYNQAIGLKPNEQYPKEQIEIISELLEEVLE